VKRRSPPHRTQSTYHRAESAPALAHVTLARETLALMMHDPPSRTHKECP